MARGRPRLTPWFDGTVRPWRVGVYQRKTALDGVVWARWDGRQWFIGCERRSEAAATSIASVVPTGFAWRGRAERARP